MPFGVVLLFMYSLEESIPKHVNVIFQQVKVMNNIAHIQNNIKIKN
jgi:hypothetical protein